LEVDGSISANGAGTSDGGSGGSVYITTGKFSGNGTISANGHSQNCNGGGGRIAIYYEDASGFANFTNVSANAGGPGAQDGSVVFIDRTVTSGLAIQIYDDLTLPASSTNEFASMSLSPSATLTLGGGSLLGVNGTLTIQTNATVICQGANTTAPISNQWMGVGVAITASDLTLAAGGLITANGQGYSSAGSGGAGPGGGQAGFGGGSYGGLGSGPSGPAYGNALAPTDLGSAGWSSSQGGGAIKLVVSNEFVLDGTISANGECAADGASGGSIYIMAGNLSGDGFLMANGNAQNCAGGGGRVAVYYAQSLAFPTNQITAAAGGPSAQNGTVYVSATTPPVTLSIEKAAGGGLSVNWPQGTLLQATNLLGPWTTNSATSPCLVPGTNAQMFFKLLLQ
jgi:hypothetical protein